MGQNEVDQIFPSMLSQILNSEQIGNKVKFTSEKKSIVNSQTVQN